jgi:hypothetical protein
MVLDDRLMILQETLFTLLRLPQHKETERTNISSTRESTHGVPE